MSLSIYNSLSKKEEAFHPINPEQITMYHCGPTVYDRVHIGNLRSFFLADTLRRYFEFTGKNVLQVMNITDIGHISGDADFGDDKMVKLLKRKGLPITLENMLRAAGEEAKQFEQDLSAMNILKPHKLPKASDHIKEQVAMIQKLIENGNAYTTDEAIYFDVTTDKHYGALGGLTTEGGKEHSRVENSQKRNVQDFALWKFDTDGFKSDLGTGYPGWHIECSAMSTKYLGDEFDIHTGGIDLKPIHHNNEIAQATCATHNHFAHYWIHGEFLTVGDEKMAKSFGNMFTLTDLEEKNISPLALRVLFLQAHYRSVLNFSWDALEASQKVLADIYRFVAKYGYLHNAKDLDTTLSDGDKQVSPIIDAYTHDLNTSKAFSHFMNYLADAKTLKDKVSLILAYSALFGFGAEKILPFVHTEINKPDIQNLISKRGEARLHKDYEASDTLRDELLKHGITCEDGKEGSYYFPKNILGVEL